MPPMDVFVGAANWYDWVHAYFSFVKGQRTRLIAGFPHPNCHQQSAMRRLLPFLFLFSACGGSSQSAYDRELAKLQGIWLLTEIESLSGEILNGEKPMKPGNTVSLEISGEKYLVRDDGEVVGRGRLVIDPISTPKKWDQVIEKGRGAGKVLLAVYELEENTLRICVAPPGDPDRPTGMIGWVNKFSRQEPATSPRE